jgi:hypothetical protein
MTVFRSPSRSGHRLWKLAILGFASLACLISATDAATFEKVVMSRDKINLNGNRIRFATFEAAAFNDKDFVAFFSNIYGQGVTLSNNNAIFLRVGKRTNMIARANQVVNVQGTDLTLTLTTNFLVNKKGYVLWSGTDATLGETLISLTNRNSAAYGMALITGTTVGTEPIVDLNNANRISFLALDLSEPSLPPTVWRVGFTENSPLVQVGDNAIGMAFGSTYTGFGAPTLDQSNNVYFTAGISGRGSVYDGIWYGKGHDPRPIAVINRTAPGTGGAKFSAFLDSPHPSSNGKYCAFLADATPASAPVIGGIWLATVATHGVKNVAAEGDHTGTGASKLTFRKFEPPAVNNQGHCAFLAVTAGAGGNKLGLFFATAPGDVEKVVARGDTIRVDGKNLKVSDVKFKPRGGLNNNDKILVTLSFSNRTTGIFIVKP